MVTAIEAFPRGKVNFINQVAVTIAFLCGAIGNWAGSDGLLKVNGVLNIFICANSTYIAYGISQIGVYGYSAYPLLEKGEHLSLNCFKV